MSKKNVALLVSLLLIGSIGGLLLVVGREPISVQSGATESNVAVVQGKQIVTITAKGGYKPRVSTARAGIPTVLKVVTQGTFDCSAALTIPSLAYRTNLEPTGEALIDMPAQQPGAQLQGLCEMGMYSFRIDFE